MRPTVRVFALSSFALCFGAGACGGSGSEGSGTGGAPSSTGTGGIAVPVSGSGGTSVAVGSGGGTGSGTSHTGGASGLGGETGQPATGGNPGTGNATATGGRAGANTGGASGANGNRPDAGVDAAGPGTGGGGSVNQGSLPSVTLHLAGDSTVMTYAAGSLQEGWGQELGQFFVSGKVTIDNQAIGGASVQTFESGSRWTNITSALKAGDFVMMQFGANDSGSVAGRHVSVPDFQAAFSKMADQIKAKQATPILVTPSAFREWSGNTATNIRLGPYAATLIALGQMKNLEVDDLNARGVELLNKIGPTGAAALYIGVDKAHFTKAGAVQMAQFVADELRRIGSPLAAYLK